MAGLNPYRDPAMLIELGQRVLSELMTQADWREILERWAAMEKLGIS